MQYILIHGAWQGGWCWEFLAKELRQLGHSVLCLDLPGHGTSSFPLSDVTYEAYYQKLEEEINKYNDVVLVAHSMSGTFAAPLFDRYQHRISHLFLIAAFVAQDGQSLMDIVIAGEPSEIPNIVLPNDERNNTQSLDLQKASAFYFDCSREISDWAIRQLQPQPLEPFNARINWKDSGNTIHKRTYVLCEEDRDMRATTQLSVLDRYPCKIVKLKSGHFPFLSQPKELSKILSHF